MKGYMRVLGLVREGKPTRNRQAKDTLIKRRFGKLCGKDSWFKLDRKDGEEKPKTGTKNTGKKKVQEKKIIEETPHGDGREGRRKETV